MVEILRSLGISAEVPQEPKDLGELERLLVERSESLVALAHFDLAPYRRYGLDLYATLRHLQMTLRKLVLLVQSHTSFASLLPKDNPFSTIDIKTVELLGRR